MFSTFESVQWFDPGLLCARGPLATSGDAEAADAGDIHGETEAHTLRRLLVQQHLHRELSENTLSSSPANSAHVYDTLAHLKYARPSHSYHRRQQQLEEQGTVGSRGLLGLTQQRSFWDDEDEEEAAGVGVGVGSGGRGTGAGGGTEPALHLFPHDNAFGAGARPFSSPIAASSRRDAAASPAPAAALAAQRLFHDVPLTLGVEVGTVLCPMVLHGDPLPAPARARPKVHMSSSHEIFALTTRTVPQRLLLFDQLNDIPISDIDLTEGPLLPTGSTERDGNNANAMASASFRQRQLNAEAAEASGYPMSAVVVPCSVEVQDTVRALVFDSSGHFLVVTYASGKAAYLFVPRRTASSSSLAPSTAPEGDGQGGGGGPPMDGKAAATEEERAARQQRNDQREVERRRRHKEWRAEAKRWATLGLQKKHKKPSAANAGRDEANAPSFSPRNGEAEDENGDDDDEVYRPTVFSLTLLCEERRRGKGSAQWFAGGGKGGGATTAAAAAAPFVIESIAWRINGRLTRSATDKATTMDLPSSRHAPPPSSVSAGETGACYSPELLLGSRHGGILLCCQLTSNLGAVRTRVVYAFPSPFARKPIHSIVCYVAPAPEGVVGSAAGDGGKGRGARKARHGVEEEGGDEDSSGDGLGGEDSSARFASFSHTPHFLDVDRGDGTGDGVAATPIPPHSPNVPSHPRPPPSSPSRAGVPVSRCFVLLSVQNHLFVFATPSSSSPSPSVPSPPSASGGGGGGHVLYASVESAFTSSPHRWTPAPSSPDGFGARGRGGGNGSHCSFPRATPTPPMHSAAAGRADDSNGYRHHHFPQPRVLENYITLDPSMLQVSPSVPSSSSAAAATATATAAGAVAGKGKVYLVLPEQLQNPEDFEYEEGQGGRRGNPLAWNAPDGITAELPPIFYWQYGSACLVQGVLLHGALNVLERVRTMLRRQAATKDPWVDRLLFMALSHVERASDNSGEPRTGGLGDATTETNRHGSVDTTMTLLPIGILSVIHLPDRLKSLGQLIHATAPAVDGEKRTWPSSALPTAVVMFKRAHVLDRGERRRRGKQRRRPAHLPVKHLIDPVITRGEITSETLSMFVILKKQYYASRQWSLRHSTSTNTNTSSIDGNRNGGTRSSGGVGGVASPGSWRQGGGDKASPLTAANVQARRGGGAEAGPAYMCAPTDERVLSFSASYDHMAVTTTRAFYLFAHLAAVPLPGSRLQGLPGALSWKGMLIYSTNLARTSSSNDNATPSPAPAPPAAVPRACRDAYFPSLFYLLPSGGDDMVRFDMTRTHTQRGFAVAQLLALADRMHEEERIEQAEQMVDDRRSYDPQVRGPGAAADAAARGRRGDTAGPSGMGEGASSRQTSDRFLGGGRRGERSAGLTGHSFAGEVAATRAATVCVQPSAGALGQQPRGREVGYHSGASERGARSPSSSSSSSADSSPSSSSSSTASHAGSISSSASAAAAASDPGSFGRAARLALPHEKQRARSRLACQHTVASLGSSSHASSSHTAPRGGGDAAHALGSRWHALTAATTARAGLASLGNSNHHSSGYYAQGGEEGHDGPLTRRSRTTNSFTGNGSFGAGSFADPQGWSRAQEHQPYEHSPPLANVSFFGSPATAAAATNAAQQSSSFFSPTSAQPLLHVPEREDSARERVLRYHHHHMWEAVAEGREGGAGSSAFSGSGISSAGGRGGQPVRTRLGFRVVRVSDNEERFIRFLDTNPILYNLLDHALASASTFAADQRQQQQSLPRDAHARALVIPTLGVAPGVLNTAFLSPPSSSSSRRRQDHMSPSSLEESTTTSRFYYQPDHIYAMALRLSASLMRTNFAASRTLLDKTRHAYGSFLMRHGRHLEAAVQWGRISTAFFSNELTSFNTLFVEFCRVVRQSVDLEPLVVLLRLRLQACEAAEVVGGGGAAVGNFVDCNAEKSILATLLVHTLLDLWNERDVARGSTPAAHSAPAHDTEAAASSSLAQQREDEERSSSPPSSASSPHDMTTLEFIRRKYHLDNPLMLLEDVLLRYRGLLSSAALTRALEGIASARHCAYVQELLQRSLTGGGDGGGVEGTEGVGAALGDSGEAVCTTLFVRGQRYWEGLQRLKEYHTPSAVPAFFLALRAHERHDGGGNSNYDDNRRGSCTSTRQNEGMSAKDRRVSFSKDALAGDVHAEGPPGSSAALPPPRPRRCAALSLTERALVERPFPLYAIQPQPQPQTQQQQLLRRERHSLDGGNEISASRVADTSRIATVGSVGGGTARGARRPGYCTIPGVTYVAKPSVSLTPAAQARLWARFTPLLLRRIPRCFVHDGLLPQIEHETRTYGTALVNPRDLLPSLLLYKPSWNVLEAKQYAAAALSGEGEGGRSATQTAATAEQYVQQRQQKRRLSVRSRRSSSSREPGSHHEALSSSPDAHDERKSAITLAYPEAYRDASMSMSTDESLSLSLSSAFVASVRNSDNDDDGDGEAFALGPGGDDMVSVDFFQKLLPGMSGEADGPHHAGTEANLLDPAVALTLSSLLVRHGSDALLRGYMAHLAATAVAEANRVHLPSLPSTRGGGGDGPRDERISRGGGLSVSQNDVFSRSPAMAATAMPLIRSLSAYVYRVSFARGRLLGCAWAQHVLGHHTDAQRIALQALHCPELAVRFLQLQKARYDALQDGERATLIAEEATTTTTTTTDDAVAAAATNSSRGGLSSESRETRRAVGGGHRGHAFVAEKEMAKRRRLWLGLIAYLLDAAEGRQGRRVCASRDASVQATQQKPPFSGSNSNTNDTAAEFSFPEFMNEDERSTARRRQSVLAMTGASDVLLDAHGGPAAALQLIPLSGGDVNITDILPLLAPTTSIGRFKEDLLGSLTAVSARIRTLQDSIDSGGQEAAVLQRDLLRSRSSHVALSSFSSQQQRCALCRQPALSRPFVAFPRCKHTMHLSCYYHQQGALLGLERHHSGNAAAAAAAERHEGTDDVVLQVFSMSSDDDDDGAHSGTRQGGLLRRDTSPPDVANSSRREVQPLQEQERRLSCLLCAPKYVRLLLLKAPLSLQLTASADTAASTGSRGQATLHLP